MANLLTNAIKFSPENTTITITVTKEDKEILLALEDQGLGIPPGVIEKLQNNEIITTIGLNNEKGTGLGTKIVYEIMEELEGRVIIETRHGISNSGTKFSLVFPTYE